MSQIVLQATDNDVVILTSSSIEIQSSRIIVLRELRFCSHNLVPGGGGGGGGSLFSSLTFSHSSERINSLGSQA